jgi:intracellular multiplication protein IcmO
VDWNDLTSLIEGEAIVLFGGRRIYARVFHAKINDTGPKRIGRSLMLQPPDANELRARLERAGQVAAAIETGQLMVGSNVAVSTGLAALLRGFSTAAGSGSTAHDCARNALAEIANLPDSDLPARPAPPADGTPVTSLTPMLSVSSKHVFAGPEQAALPNEPVDDRLLRSIAEIERASGVGETMLRGAGLSILADRDEALAETVIVEPPSMSAEALEMHIKAIIQRLGKLQSAANLKRAA